MEYGCAPGSNRMVSTVVRAWVKSTKVDPTPPKMAVAVGPNGGAFGVQLVGSFQSVVLPFQVAVWASAGAAHDSERMASAATALPCATGAQNVGSDPRRYSTEIPTARTGATRQFAPPLTPAAWNLN